MLEDVGGGMTLFELVERISADEAADWLDQAQTEREPARRAERELAERMGL